MASYSVINGTAVDVVITAAAGNQTAKVGDAVTSITLTAAELATVLATAGVAVVKDTTTEDQRVNLRRIIRQGRYEGDNGGASGHGRR